MGSGVKTAFKFTCTYRFEEAMKHHMVNVPEHMLKIKQALEVPGAEEDVEEVERKEGLLEELLEIVENIDHAKGEGPTCITTLTYFSAVAGSSRCEVS